MVKANWSGVYPCLCTGEWTLIVNGENVTEKIPKQLRNSPMNTYRVYERWGFDENYSEIFENYTDGLDCESWIEDNEYWLDTITGDCSVWEEIFYAINAKDFRRDSCGGCI